MPVRTGLVGYGYSGRTFHAPLIESVDGLSLCAVVSGDRDKVRIDRPDLAVISLADLIADSTVDLAVVATPNASHFAIAQALILGGKHVVVEKPLTVTIAEAETLRASIEQTGRILTVFQNRRWDADFLTLRTLLDGHALGRVVQFESRFERYRPAVRDRWRERPGPGSGTWWDLGAHLVDQVMQLFGEPDSVYGDLGVQRGAGAVDFFHALLRYGAARVILQGSSLAVAGGPRFHVLGTEGSYVKYGFDPQEDALRAGHRPGASAEWGDDPQTGALTRVDDNGPQTVRVPNVPGDYRAFYVGLRDAIVSGAAPPVTLSDALAVIRVLELVDKSSEFGRSLAVRTHQPGG
jgi:predicted dehydrogenase